MGKLDLSPAKWIWFPSERTLPNTVVLFRKTFDLLAPADGHGFISADSRYRLWINGQRVQWGPAPCDPRHLDADPFSLADLTRTGRNVIAVEVLHYGYGEGTWPFGKPGFIFKLDHGEGQICSDTSWKCLVDRGHPPGQHRRWYLRALQEVQDLRVTPDGWNRPEFDDSTWLSPRLIECPADRSPVSSWYTDFQSDTWMVDPATSTLEERTIPPMAESLVSLGAPIESFNLSWGESFDDWFDFRTPKAFEAKPGEVRTVVRPQRDRESTAITFESDRERIGFPVVEVSAPDGTIIEVISQESKAKGGALLDTHLYTWSRFVCRDGENTFEPLDYEAVKYLQLHVRGNTAPVTVRKVGLRVREFPFPHEPDIKVSDPTLQRVLDADIQTVRNSCQDVAVDGMGRERQQYSGDCSHQLHVARLVFGDARASERFLRTFVRGQLSSGIWLDSWPAADRLNRLWQREMGLSVWGPILDHGIGFLCDHVNHAYETGDTKPLRDNWRQIKRFYDYVLSLQDPSGLLPVAGAGAPTVWIDHIAFPEQSDKACALTLYWAYALRLLSTVISEALGEGPTAIELRQRSDALVTACRQRFGHDGLVWARPPGERGSGHLDDRSLATLVLLDGDRQALNALEEKPKGLGESYPANRYWPYRARAELGSLALLLREVKDKWGGMVSVRKNGTVQEYWEAEEGSAAVMSHCAVAPLAAVIWGLFGLRARLDQNAFGIAPRLGGLESWEATLHLPAGALHVRAWKQGDVGRAEIMTPPGHDGHLWRTGEKLSPNGKTVVDIPLD